MPQAVQEPDTEGSHHTDDRWVPGAAGVAGPVVPCPDSTSDEKVPPPTASQFPDERQLTALSSASATELSTVGVQLVPIRASMRAAVPALSVTEPTATQGPGDRQDTPLSPAPEVPAGRARAVAFQWPWA